MVSRVSPFHFALVLSGSVHLGLLALLAWSTTAAIAHLPAVEVALIERSVPWTEPVQPVRRRAAEPGRMAKPAAEVEPVPSAPPTLENQNLSAEAPESYALDVVRAINRHKVYPPVALRLRQQGRVTVRFKVDRSGSVLSAEVIGKSAHELLNGAAEKLIRQIRALPPFPEGERASAWLFTVPIEYIL